VSSVLSSGLLAIEMTARTIKKIIDEKLRWELAQKSSENAFTNMVCNYLNKIFSNSPEIWNEIHKKLSAYYLDGQELDTRSCIWSFIPDKIELTKTNSQDSSSEDYDSTPREEERPYHGPELLFAKIQKLLGIQFNDTFVKSLFHAKTRILTSGMKNIFTPLMVNSFHGKIKHMHVIYHAEGQLWKWIKDDRLKNGSSLLLSKKYCSLMAAQKFDDALVAHPTSVASLRWAVKCRYDYWKERCNKSITLKHEHDFVTMQFKFAIQLNPTDINTYVLFHEVLMDSLQFEEAEDILLDYLENVDPLDKTIKIHYMTFLYKAPIEKKEHFVNKRKEFKKELSASKSSSL